MFTARANGAAASADRPAKTGTVVRHRLVSRKVAGYAGAFGLAGAAMVLIAGPAGAAQGRVGLGTADSFAVLAGSGITNTGATTISGDVGTFPTPSETGFGSVILTGTNHAGDGVTQGAKSGLVTAYNDAFTRTPATNVPVELGGSTLTSGVYTSPTFGLTGTLSLDAASNPNAEFIFQAASTVIAEANSRVLLVNGANPCNVVWQVGSSATFKTGTHFVGDVLAQTSITAQTGATFQGRLLARDGAVTLDTNTITRGNCAAPTAGSSGTPTPTPSASTTPSGSAGSTPPGVRATPAAGTTLVGTPGKPSPAGGSTSSSAGPATSSASTTATPGLSTGTPGVPQSNASLPPTTPRLPFTGLPVLGLAGAALALLAAGSSAAIIGRRNRKVEPTH